MPRYRVYYREVSYVEVEAGSEAEAEIKARDMDTTDFPIEENEWEVVELNEFGFAAE